MMERAAFHVASESPGTSLEARGALLNLGEESSPGALQNTRGFETRRPQAGRARKVSRVRQKQAGPLCHGLAFQQQALHRAPCEGGRCRALAGDAL
jgi:hypothetical protein